VIAVIASRLDPEARAVVADWATADAALLSAEDLVSSGWSFRALDPASGTAVVDGRRVRTAEVTAVLTRRPAVLAEELGRIHPADRPYVAAETNAFLVAWLHALRCRVVNRPTATSLCGPAWDKVHWQSAAGRIGVRWSDSADASDAHEVVVCGRQCLFARDGEEAAMAAALSREAGTELLGVRFQRGKVSSVTVAPPLADAEVRACLLDHLVCRS
jgi:hypothetical protein